MEAARKELRRTPVYDKRDSSKLGYVKYADDWAILVNGTKREAEHLDIIRNREWIIGVKSEAYYENRFL